MGGALLVGDRALVVERRDVAAALAAHPAIEDVRPSRDTMLVCFDPLRVGPDELAARMGALPASSPAAAGRVEIPVSYGGEHGPDLDEVCRHAGLDREAVIAHHSGAEYVVEFLGFSPGFPYLGGLPPALAIPRLPSPRPRVPAGSVGIARERCGIYPQEMPGGWRIVGRTDAVLFDLAREPMALLAPGDRVSFVPVAALDVRPARPTAPCKRDRGALLVVQPGPLTTVQDAGRLRQGPLAIAPAGSADPVARRLANAAVGNEPGAAGLEMTLSGPTLAFDEPAIVALSGGASASIPENEPVRVPAGERLRIGALRGSARAFLAVRGGIDVPPVLASRSTHVPTGIGGAALAAGERLPIGRAVRGEPRRIEPLPPPGSRALGVIPGLSTRDGALDALCAAEWRVAADSNRVGVRLDGGVVPAGDEGVSEGVAIGAIQVTPGGQPIVLFVDGPTTGGYPRFANVISADLHRLARLRAADPVRFERVSFADAVDRLRRLEQELHDRDA